MEKIKYDVAEGYWGRVFVVRFRTGSDLMLSLKEVCEKNNIKNGNITSVVGSLYKTKFHYGIPDDSKSGAGFSPEQNIGTMCEYIAGHGTVCHDEKSGETLFHFHSIVNDNGFLRGGHMALPGNIVATTIEMVIQEICGVSMTRPFDADVDQNHLFPKKI